MNNRTEDLADKVLVLLLGGAVLGILTLIGMGIYVIIGTYNERRECQRLGVPLYRCSAQTYKADINIGQ